ncbi:hypothetical protein PG991_012159 [Apiospora marii]|uniref:Uncharacterized protein n=1 Tax=Apiospora marii TaxID=335849 RepID=A0ABR1R9E1_9PEZI
MREEVGHCLKILAGETLGDAVSRHGLESLLDLEGELVDLRGDIVAGLDGGMHKRVLVTVRLLGQLLVDLPFLDTHGDDLVSLGADLAIVSGVDHDLTRRANRQVEAGHQQHDLEIQCFPVHLLVVHGPGAAGAKGASQAADCGGLWDRDIVGGIRSVNRGHLRDRQGECFIIRGLIVRVLGLISHSRAGEMVEEGTLTDGAALGTGPTKGWAGAGSASSTGASDARGFSLGAGPAAGLSVTEDGF